MKINRSFVDGSNNLSNTNAAGDTGRALESEKSPQSIPRGVGSIQDRFENAKQAGSQNRAFDQMLSSPGRPGFQESPFLQKQNLPEGGLNTPLQSSERDEPLTPEEMQEARADAETEQAAADRYQNEDGTWDMAQIEHDMMNVALARRLADDVDTFGRDDHNVDPGRIFDRGDRDRLEHYADTLGAGMLGLPEDIFQRAADLADTSDAPLMQYYYGDHGLGGGLGRQPSSDFSPDGMDPGRGRRPEQQNPVQPGPHSGSHSGPQPGEGGTLTGHHRHSPENHRRTSPGGHSQKGSGNYGMNGGNDGGGMSGGNKTPSNDSQSTVTPSSHRNDGPALAGAYRRETGASYSLNSGPGSSGESNQSQSTGNSDTGKKDKTGKEGLGPSESTGDLKTIPVTGLPADPETGGSRGGDDLSGGKLEKYKVKGVPQQQKDLVGPAFAVTTGADDKDRPATGGTSGTVATNTSESRANDVGGSNMARRTGGGTVDRSAGTELLMQLGLLAKLQPGGPDPEK